jgi:hypothetical protein
MHERLWIVGRIQDYSSVGTRLFESRHLTFEKFGSRDDLIGIEGPSNTRA